MAVVRGNHGIYMPNEGSFDLFVHPTLHGTMHHEVVMDEYMAWAEARAREAGLKQIWPFWAIDYDEVLTRLMRGHGFVVDQACPAPPLFERTLDDIHVVDLIAGALQQNERPRHLKLDVVRVGGNGKGSFGHVDLVMGRSRDSVYGIRG